MGVGIIELLNQDGTLTYCNLEILILWQSIYIVKGSSDSHILVFGGDGNFRGGAGGFFVVGLGAGMFLPFLEVLVRQIFRQYIIRGW